MNNFWIGFEKKARELTTEARNKIPTGEFAIEKKRKYPIEDKAHARNALARVSAFGSPSEKAEVRREVRQKYPDIGKK